MDPVHKRDFPFAVLDAVRNDCDSSFLKIALHRTDIPKTELKSLWWITETRGWKQTVD